MERCKLIKDKKCLLLNRLRGDLIVSDFVSEIPLVSGKRSKEKNALAAAPLADTGSQSLQRGDHTTRYTNTQAHTDHKQDFTGRHGPCV